MKKPDEADLKNYIADKGIKSKDYGIIYYDAQSMDIKLDKFIDKGKNWLASYSVKANSPYINLNFKIEVPYKVDGDEITIYTDDVLVASSEQLLPNSKDLPSLNIQELKDMWISEGGITIYDHGGENSAYYRIEPE